MAAPQGKRAAFVPAPPNEDLFRNGDGLRRMRRPAKDGAGDIVGGAPLVECPLGPIGARFEWLNAAMFEHFADDDEELTRLLAAARDRGYSQRAIAAIQTHLFTRVVPKYLAYLQAMFHAAEPMLAEYLAARDAHVAAFPDDV